MARTKVFCDIPTLNGYDGDPVDSFRIHVDYVVHFVNDEGVSGHVGSACDVYIPLDSSPFTVFGDVYADILTYCATNGYTTPTKADIFGYVPASFTQLIPEVPSFA
jgi:hypothetical protein